MTRSRPIVSLIRVSCLPQPNSKPRASMISSSTMRSRLYAGVAGQSLPGVTDGQAMSPSHKLAQRLALGIPAVLLAGAYVSEYAFGLYPCEMCWWQRYPHFAAILLALVSTVVRPRTLWIALA